MAFEVFPASTHLEWDEDVQGRKRKTFKNIWHFEFERVLHNCYLASKVVHIAPDFLRFGVVFTLETGERCFHAFTLRAQIQKNSVPGIQEFTRPFVDLTEPPQELKEKDPTLTADKFFLFASYLPQIYKSFDSPNSCFSANRGRVSFGRSTVAISAFLQPRPTEKPQKPYRVRWLYTTCKSIKVGIRTFKITLQCKPSARWWPSDQTRRVSTLPNVPKCLSAVPELYTRDVDVTVSGGNVLKFTPGSWRIETFDDSATRSSCQDSQDTSTPEPLDVEMTPFEPYTDTYQPVWMQVI